MNFNELRGHELSLSLENPLLKCSFLVRIESDKIELLQKNGEASFLLLRKVSSSRKIFQENFLKLVIDVPRDAPICVTLGNSMSALIHNIPRLQGNYVTEDKKNLNIAAHLNSKSNSFKLTVSRSFLKELRVLLNDRSQVTSIFILFRMPSVNLPLSIFVDLSSKPIVGNNLAPHVTCLKSDGIFQTYSRGIIGSSNANSTAIPLEVISDEKETFPLLMFAKSILAVCVKHIANINPTNWLGGAKQMLRDTGEHGTRLATAARNFVSKAPTLRQAIASQDFKQPLAGLRQYVAPARPHADIVIINDDSTQTAFCVTLMLKHAYSDRFVVELGAYREKIRSKFSLFFGAAKVLETNNLPLTLNDAGLALDQLIEITENKPKVTLVIGKEIFTNPSFQNLMSSLMQQCVIKSISVFGFDNVSISKDMASYMAEQCNSITLVTCGKRENPTSIPAIHEGFNTVVLSNIKFEDLKEINRGNATVEKLLSRLESNKDAATARLRPLTNLDKWVDQNLKLLEYPR